jgi:hypothetical protein
MKVAIPDTSRSGSRENGECAFAESQASRMGDARSRGRLGPNPATTLARAIPYAVVHRVRYPALRCDSCSSRPR